jgi:hypothetical protein
VLKKEALLHIARVLARKKNWDIAATFSPTGARSSSTKKRIIHSYLIQCPTIRSKINIMQM